MLGVLHNPYKSLLVCGFNHANIVTEFTAAHNLKVSSLATLVALLFPGWALLPAVLRGSLTPWAGLGRCLWFILLRLLLEVAMAPTGLVFQGVNNSFFLEIIPQECKSIIKFSTGSPISCFRLLNLALSKIMFFHFTKYPWKLRS